MQKLETKNLCTSDFTHTVENVPYRNDTVRVIGNDKLHMPTEMASLQFVRKSGDYGLLVLLPGTNLDELFQELLNSGKLAVPIADFSGRLGSRADFTANFASSEKFREAIASTQPIRDRLNELPPIKADENVAALSALAIAYSRDKLIPARFDPKIREAISYPTLMGISEPRKLMEDLVDAHLVSRQFFDRLHLCGQCKSSRILAREVCPGCQRPELNEEIIVHHYRCGFQGLRSEFQKSSGLVCPKCSRDLNHHGVDYDTPSGVLACRGCTKQFQDPNVVFVCTDCRAETPANDSETFDWFDYVLRPETHDALLRNIVPSVQRKNAGSQPQTMGFSKKHGTASDACQTH